MMKRLLLFLLLFLFVAVAGYSQSGHSVTLNWSWTQGTGDPATGFHVQRGTVTGGPYTVIGTVSSPTTLTFTDTGVAAGQTFFYVVTAFNPAASTTSNPGGDSLPSNEAKAVIPFLAPQAPTGLTATPK